MKRVLVIFKGWGSPDSLYKRFQKKINAEIIFSEDLTSGALDKFDDVIALGWSMGTLDCIRFIREKDIKKSILIAPTLNFTKTTRPLMIKKMIKRLKREKAGCLRDFIELNFSDGSKFEDYLGEYFEEILNFDEDELLKGLTKLLEDRVSDSKCDLSPLIILGEEDRVIPGINSKDVIESFPNAVVKILEGGHNLIYESQEDIDKTIEDYFKI
jgi:pimeloyl-ACP methyl ester carboxylesterase